MAAQAQFTEMPIACQPHKMNLWDKMVASFSCVYPMLDILDILDVFEILMCIVWCLFISVTNDCEKYYETIMTNPRLQVTPAFAMTHFLSKTIFQPFSYLGIIVSEFLDNATSE